MHASVLEFLRRNLTRDEVEGKNVFEVGALDVNGSPRSVVLPLAPRRYLGVDQQPGLGVDCAVPCEELWHLKNLFELVISCEMLEHAREWKKCVNVMKDACMVGGLMVVTTRSVGFPRHGFPDDYWRFSLSDFKIAFSDFDILVLERDPEVPGVFLKAQKPRGWKPGLALPEVAKAPGLCVGDERV
jgi:hypothetical protein